MELLQTGIPGCYEIKPNTFRDNRGTFVKTYHNDIFAEMGLRTDWKEEYYSVSNRGVIRGMHFQTPPMQHAKMVYCLQGTVQDVILDLRTGSPSYGTCISIELSSEKANIIYLPEGVAHGFCTLTEQAIMQYKVTSVYSSQHDSGILWNSIPMDWQCTAPTLSDRDASFIRLANFLSPFQYTTS
ncbi:MAG: dTDP-4-dehydrorhamnose 3,5-epimerase [Gallionellaceae bacterium]|jgi:dTDP-4-dehydrorhamnose 3,5-epimerase